MTFHFVAYELLYFKTYVQVMVKQYEGMGVFKLFFDKIGHSAVVRAIQCILETTRPLKATFATTALIFGLSVSKKV